MCILCPTKGLASIRGSINGGSYWVAVDRGHWRQEVVNDYGRTYNEGLLRVGSIEQENFERL